MAVALTNLRYLVPTLARIGRRNKVMASLYRFLFPARNAHLNELRRMILGFMATRRLHAAARLELADIVAVEPKSLEELAQRTGAHLPSLERLVADLAIDGVLSIGKDLRVGPPPLSDLLRRDHPQSFRPMVLELASPHIQEAWNELEHTVLTGESAFEKAHGVDFWEFHASHPEVAENFNEFMVKWSYHRHQATANAYDFSTIETMVDVGGGVGGYLAHFARSNPSLKGVSFDQPYVEENAKRYLASQGVDHRCTFVAGDFFKSIPGDADLYFLAHVLHDWPDDQAIAILQSCRRAMKPESKLLIEERFGADGTGKSLAMMVTFGQAKNRSEEELRELIDKSGLKLKRVIPTSSDSTLLEAELP